MRVDRDEAQQLCGVANRLCRVFELTNASGAFQLCYSDAPEI
jgi:hypothetical protein